MSNKHDDYNSRKLAALARYEEGLCLLENEKYFAAFYMFGFVLEIGIQANLYLIEEKVLESFSNKEALALKSYFFNKEYKTLEEFTRNCPSLKEDNHIKFLIRKEPNKGKKSKGRHDLEEFINQRNDMSNYLAKKNLIEKANHIDFLKDCLDIFKDWNPNNRYKHEPDSVYRSEATEAKNKSRIFLKDVLGYEDSEIPNFVPNEIKGEMENIKLADNTLIITQTKS